MSKEEKFEIRWDVRNVELFWKEKVSLISPTFQEENILHPHRLRIIITRAIDTELKEESTERFGEATEKEFMSLYLQNLFFENCKNQGRILNVTFLLVHPLREEIVSQSRIQFNGCSRVCFGFDRFICLKKLKACGLRFTIVCKFKILEQDFKSYAHFFNDNSSSDIKLIVGVDEIQTFALHKLVLALGSLHFQLIFDNDRSISCLRIDDTRLEMAVEILRYIYTGKASYTEQNIYELFEVALRYRVHGLCWNFQQILVENLNLANVLRMSLIDKPEILTELVAYLSTSNFLRKACVEEESSTCSGTCHNRFKIFAKSSEFSDIVIKVNDLEFPAHKLILSARSPFFRRMFSHIMKETTSGVVTVKDIRPPIFEKLLGFMYTNEIESEDDDIQEILIASDKYEMDDLKLICEKILEEKLTADNVITTLILAADHNAERLKKKCLRFVTYTDSPFWSHSSDNFSVPKSILNRNLAESRPHLLYDMLTEIHRERFS